MTADLTDNQQAAVDYVNNYEGGTTADAVKALAAERERSYGSVVALLRAAIAKGVEVRSDGTVKLTREATPAVDGNAAALAQALSVKLADSPVVASFAADAEKRLAELDTRILELQSETTVLADERSRITAALGALAA